MTYFKSDDDFIYINAPKAELYIPKDYFSLSGNFAQMDSESVHGIGVYNIAFFDKNDNQIEMRVLNLPSWTDFYIHDIQEDVNVALPGYEENIKCTVLTYLQGHKFIPAKIVEDSSNVEAYTNFILKGKTPLVKYEDSLKLWMKNQSLNSCSLGVRPEILELILSATHRYKGDYSKKFAHVIGKSDKVSQYDCVTNNIRQICQNTSTFTALTFEDQDSMLTASINRARKGVEEAFSPIEMLLKL